MIKLQTHTIKTFQLKIKTILILAIFMTIYIECQFQDCEKLRQQWIEDPASLPPLVFANSGKFLNDLGDYNNCLHHAQDYVYITMSVFNKMASNSQFMGLCAPIQCKQYLTSNKQTQALVKYVNDAFKNSTNSTFQPFTDMIFYSPVDNQPEMDWSNYMAVGLIIVLTIFGVLGSLAGKVAPESRLLVVKVLKSFSFYDNFVKIVDVPKTMENQNLLFINGCRVLSIFWIVFGHDMWFRFMNIKNWMDGINILTTPGTATLAPAAYFAVDTFFWIGGFLITIGMLEQMKKKMKFIFFYFGCIVHRFIRIWPTYMVAILFFWKISPYFGNGPIWNSFQAFASECDDGGVIMNMLFVDNFGNHGPNGRNYCFGWGWYLAVDFQLFLITPFLFYAYKKNKKLGWIITFLFFLASVVTAFTMIYVNQWRYPIINSKLKPQPDFMDKFYYKPYVRASAYFMGIFSGYIYYEWKNNNQSFVKVIDKIKNSITIRILFYVVGISLTQLTIWIIVPYQSGQIWSNLAQALYNSLNRVFFILGVYLCVFAAMFGCKNDPSKLILGHKFFSPLAKVSFCIYLTHFTVIMNGTFSSRMDLYWQDLNSLYHITTDVFYSILTALALSLLVQSPTLGLEKIFLRGGSKKKTQQISKKDIEVLQKSYNSFEGQQIKQRLITNYHDPIQTQKTKSNEAQILL